MERRDWASESRLGRGRMAESDGSIGNPDLADNSHGGEAGAAAGNFNMAAGLLGASVLFCGIRTTVVYLQRERAKYGLPQKLFAPPYAVKLIGGTIFLGPNSLKISFLVLAL